MGWEEGGIEGGWEEEVPEEEEEEEECSVPILARAVARSDGVMLDD